MQNEIQIGVRWQALAINKAARAAQKQQTPRCIWFTGLSGSGKSTVAHLLERRLFALNCQTVYLDGDNVRHGLNGDLGFSPKDRQENIRRVAEVAHLAFEHGQIVLCTFISPFRADRELARTLLPTGRFLEIYVKCSLEVCIQRDPKGLYAKAQRGEIAEFTGLSSPYEEPLQPELVVQTDARTAEEIVDQIIATLMERAIIARA